MSIITVCLSLAALSGASAQDTFVITGVFREMGNTAVGRKIWALPADSHGQAVRTFTIARPGALELVGPVAVTDSAGRFTLTLKRDPTLIGKRGKQQVALCWEPGLFQVTVDVTEARPAYDADVAAGPSGIPFFGVEKLGVGTTLTLSGVQLTMEAFGDSRGFRLAQPARFEAEGAQIELRSLVLNANGAMSWNSVTTTARNGKAVEWEAVVENGWVVAYRIVKPEAASLEGQQIAIPAARTLFLATVRGDTVVGEKRLVPRRSVW